MVTEVSSLPTWAVNAKRGSSGATYQQISCLGHALLTSMRKAIQPVLAWGTMPQRGTMPR